MPRRCLFIVLVGTIITLNLLPAWDIHIVPESVRKLFNFRYDYRYSTGLDMWESGRSRIQRKKEDALALKRRFTPEDTLVVGSIGVTGYYSGMSVYDAHGLVTRKVALREKGELLSPGHDARVSREFFYPDEPTVTHFQRVDGPPPTRKNPEYPLSRRLRETADIWRYDPPGTHWKRYVPEALPLPPSPDGTPNALLVWLLIEEEPYIRTLPRRERERIRRKRAVEEWDKFYASLENVE